MVRRPKTLREFRREAVEMARMYARERDLVMDPEGAGEFRDLASNLSRLRLTTNRENRP